MAEKRPGYEDWKSKPDLRGETPDTPEGHRIIFWLWIIGMVIFGFLVWGLAEITRYLRP
jgi:hypothetical protein